jgi:hypothetical protein
MGYFHGVRSTPGQSLQISIRYLPILNQCLQVQDVVTLFSSHENDRFHLRIFFEDRFNHRMKVHLSMFLRQNPGAGLSQTCDVVDLIFPISRVQQDWNGPDFLKGEIGKDKLMPVGKLDHYPIERLDIQSHEADSKTVDIFPNLRVGIAAILVYKCLSIRVNICGLVQVIAESKTRPPTKTVIFLSILIFS